MNQAIKDILLRVYEPEQIEAMTDKEALKLVELVIDDEKKLCKWEKIREIKSNTEN